MKKAIDRSMWIASMLLFVLAVAPACKKDKDKKDPNAYTLTANANSAQENNPSNTSTATGTLSGTYNSSTNKLTYNISWNGLTGNPTGLHFHGPAMAGTNAGIALALTITTALAGGGANGEATLTEAQEADLLAGKWYWNVHTPTYPGGEIRGQVVATQ